MEQVCPLCNGLQEMHVPCKDCRTAMTDGGMVSDYVSDYSPYWLSTQVRAENETCTHLFWCPSCGKESYAIVQQDLY